MIHWKYNGKKLDSKNIYHRYLKLPFEITKPDICKTIPETMQHIDINPYRDLELEKWHTDLGLITRHVEVFYTPPNGGELPIHVDDVEVNDRAKINITWGPAEGTIRWWVSDKVKQIDGVDAAKDLLGEEASIDEQFSERAHSNLVAKKEDCSLIHESTTNSPSLVNVGRLHSTWNPTKEPRWTLCFVPGSAAIRGGDYLTFEEACEAYKDYIIGDDYGN